MIFQVGETDTEDTDDGDYKFENSLVRSSTVIHGAPCFPLENLTFWLLGWALKIQV